MLLPAGLPLTWHRSHLALDSHRVVAKPILGGLLHHEYRLEKVAA
jgi:hypothetical protein